MLASKTFTNSNLVDGLLSWNHGLNTVNVIPAWKDNEGVYRTIGDLFKVVDKDNVILSCNAIIEGTHTLYLTYETSIRIVTSDANLLLSFSEQQLIRPMSAYNSTNIQAVNRYKQLAYEVECYEIDKLLGSVFYQDISKNPANYTDLLNGCSFVDRSDNTIEHRGLKYVIAYLNYAKYIGESYVNDTFTGLVQKTRPDSERISTGDIKRLQQEYREIAFNAFDLIREYLYLNPETYPLWKNERKKDMKTNKKFYGVNFRTICTFLIVLLSYNINAQSLSIARFPYKNIVQNFQGDTIWTKINGDTASIHTNLNFFNFDKPVLVNGDTIQGGSGTWPTDSANYAAKSLLNDSINALHNRTAISQHIKASDTTRWASGGVTPTDNIFHWDATNNWYTPYSSSTSGCFDNSGDSPTGSTRLNYNGEFHAPRIFGISSSSYGIYGSSSASWGIYAYSSASSAGALSATCSSGTAIYALTNYGIAGEFNQIGTPSQNITKNVINITRGHSSGTSYNITGNILLLTDNPQTTGLISGSLITGIVGSTERLRLDPRVKGNPDSTAYVLDTHRQALSTDTLLSIKNYGSNKFQVLYDGSVYSKGSIFKQGADTLATQAYARSQGGSGGTWGSITGTLSSQTDLNQVLDSLRNMLPDSIPYNTAFPFNKTLTYMSHTLTDNDVITVNSTGAINQGGGQILFINNTSYTPNLTAFKNIGAYDNTFTYSLCTFEHVHGLYIVSILNFN